MLFKTQQKWEDVPIYCTHKKFKILLKIKINAFYIVKNKKNKIYFMFNTCH